MHKWPIRCRSSQCPAKVCKYDEVEHNTGVGCGRVHFDSLSKQVFAHSNNRHWQFLLRCHRPNWARFLQQLYHQGPSWSLHSGTLGRRCRLNTGRANFERGCLVSCVALWLVQEGAMLVSTPVASMEVVDDTLYFA